MKEDLLEVVTCTLTWSMYRCMERSRGICVSGRSNSICKDPEVGTNFGMFEKHFWFFPPLFIQFFWGFQSFVLYQCVFRVTQNIHLSKYDGNFSFPPYLVAAFDTFEYFLLLEMLSSICSWDPILCLFLFVSLCLSDSLVFFKGSFPLLVLDL